MSRILPTSDREAIRRAYGAFRSGTGLRREQVGEIFATQGVPLSRNRLNELGRDSDRGSSITAIELYVLISGWAEMQNNG